MRKKKVVLRGKELEVVLTGDFNVSVEKDSVIGLHILVSQDNFSFIILEEFFGNYKLDVWVEEVHLKFL